MFKGAFICQLRHEVCLASRIGSIWETLWVLRGNSGRRQRIWQGCFGKYNKVHFADVP